MAMVKCFCMNIARVIEVEKSAKRSNNRPELSSILKRIRAKESEDAISKMTIKPKKADVVQKDIIVSNLFLKLHFDQQKMTHYSLKEPFASLVALTSFQHGGGGWT